MKDIHNEFWYMPVDFHVIVEMGLAAQEEGSGEVWMAMGSRVQSDKLKEPGEKIALGEDEWRKNVPPKATWRMN